MRKMTVNSVLVWFLCLIIPTVAISSDAPTSIPRELNPARGITIWREPPKEVVISWPSYHDFSVFKHYSFMMEGDVEITFSPYTWIGDVGPLLQDMFYYNHCKVESSCYQVQTFTLTEGGVVGKVFGESATIENLSLINGVSLIHSLEEEIYQRGGRRLYIFLPNANPEMGEWFPVNPENELTARHLEKRGYLELPGNCNLMTNEYLGTYMKELIYDGSRAGLGQSTIPAHDDTMKIEWAQEEDSWLYAPLLETFGFFVRDQHGQAKGCVWGKIEPQAAHPHAYIYLFYMDESVRGTGLGKKNHAISRNLYKESRYLANRPGHVGSPSSLVL